MLILMKKLKNLSLEEMWISKDFEDMKRSKPMKMGVPPLTHGDREVVDFTRCRVKRKSKLTNLMKISPIEGYNGKEGSNPH